MVFDSHVLDLNSGLAMPTIMRCILFNHTYGKSVMSLTLTP